MTMTYLKNGETLKLNTETCIGCGVCVDVCPHAVFRIEAGKALIETRAACMECGACARNCPAGAISVKAGVGCAGAIIIGKLRGTAPDCGGGASCGSAKSGSFC
ncbi:MAG: mercury methylation ferredoxin HgcB [Spirochaetes bacterium]|nr:mercury methylation ferredoxin HgcB [Spirochaetota bacterium]